MIYLDNAATTAVRREVIEAMWPYLTGEYGNPSSIHSLGAQAARAVAEARERVAAVLGCAAGEVIFTSGGTEGDNLAIKGIALARPRGRHLVTTSIEHGAVTESCNYLVRHHGFEVTTVGVDRDGRVDAAAMASALRVDTTLVSVMLANNEVGSIQPVAEIACAARVVGSRMHTDAVQAAGWLPLDVGESGVGKNCVGESGVDALGVDSLGVDSLTLSGHKLGAPKGIGALYLRRGVRIEALLHGGGQERGRRSGTENVAGVVGFAVALELAEASRRERSIRVTAIRNRFIARLHAEVPAAVLIGPAEERLPFNASFCFPGTGGEAVLLELERRGIFCSSGSACAAGRDEPSPVLLAMGYDAELAQTAVRFSLGDGTTPEELDQTVLAVRDALAALGALSQ